MIELNVKDMSCEHCVGVVTRTVQALDPQAKVDIDLPAKRVRIEGKAPLEQLSAALAQAGYPATPLTAG